MTEDEPAEDKGAPATELDFFNGGASKNYLVAAGPCGYRPPWVTNF